MIHKLTDIHEMARIADSAKVWAFTVIEHDVMIDEDSVIGTHCFIGAGTKIGKGVRIQTGVFIPRNSVIEDYVFIGPNVTFTDDKWPRSGNKAYFAQPPIVRMSASIGAGSVILPGIEIGAGCMIGAGAVVTKDVTLGDMAYGVPARSIKRTMGWKPELQQH